MDRGRFSGKVAEIIRAGHDGAADAPAADRQDAVAVALQTDGPAIECADVTGVDDLRPPPVVRTRVAAPARTAHRSLPSFSIVECVAALVNEAQVRKYLASEAAAYLGFGFDDVAPILEALPEQDQWLFESPEGWTEIVNYVSERLTGKLPENAAGPVIH